MTITPPGSKPVERKVTTATVATYLGTAALVGILQAINEGGLVRSLPGVLQLFVTPLLPTVITFLTGYRTKNRPQL